MNIYQDVEHMLMEAFNKVLGPKDIGKIDQNLISVEPPRDKEPVSPIKIFAGGALYHKKPKQDPTIDPQKIEASPTFGM